jgi:hypothetical protein
MHCSSPRIPVIVFLSAIIFTAIPDSGYGQVNADSVNRLEAGTEKNFQDDGRFAFALETANPKAKKLMKDKFFWSSVEESAPFGSDDGREN